MTNFMDDYRKGLRKIRETMRAEYQNLKDEMKVDFLKQAENQFDKDFKAATEEIGQVTVATKTKTKTKTKKRAPKIKAGYTLAIAFINPVRTILLSGSMPKSEVALKIMQTGLLRKADVQKHDDGVQRFYKTLDRTRKLMMERNLLTTKNGVWSLV